MGSCLQISAVSGAGMAAATFDAMQLDALGALELDTFAACLALSLLPRGAVACRVAPLAPVLIEATLETTLFAEIRHMSSTATASAPAVVGRLLDEAEVLEVVRELTASQRARSAPNSVDGGGRRLARGGGLSSRLQALTSLALSPTLIFEQPTPRSIAAHLLEQLGSSPDRGSSLWQVENDGTQWRWWEASGGGLAGATTRRPAGAAVGVWRCDGQRASG